MVKKPNYKVRNAKSKGSSFEMDVEASLQQVYPDCFRTHERGYVKQYDLQSDTGMFVVECKFHKSISWNQAKKFWQKLVTVKPTLHKPYLLFKSNQQPCLVMYQDEEGLCVREFETVFRENFIKHQSTRQLKKIEKNFAGDD